MLVDGCWENANEGILGADNKAAVAVLLALARRAHASGAPVDLELLFTVGEETRSRAPGRSTRSRLRSDFGYVFDHASPIGEVVVGSPTHFRLELSFRGAPAHAGIRPEDGRSAILAAARAVAAMPLGRLDERDDGERRARSTGGSAMNVVPERCTVARRGALAGRRAGRGGRRRDRRPRPGRREPARLRLRRRRGGAAHVLGLQARRPAARAVHVAEARCARADTSPARHSGGGSDANALIAQRLATVVNLANGTERNHEPGERVSAAALDGMLDVALALLDEAAALRCRAADG